MYKRLILSVALAVLAAAQEPQPQPQQSLSGIVKYNKAPVSNEVLRVKLPRPVEQKLSNGIKLLVVESHRVPQISLQIQMPSGNIRDPEGLHGLADATAALIRLGTKTRNAREIAETLDGMAAQVSFFAGFDSATIAVSSMTENFDAALAVLTDVLMNPTFPQDELDKWKTRQRASLEQMKTSPGALAQERMFKILYPTDARQFSRPTNESLDKITREAVIEHYKKYYVPSGEWAGIAGDITPRQAVAKLEKALSAWKGGPVQRIALPFPTPISEKKVHLISRPNSVQTYLVLTNRAFDRMNPDYIAGQVMNRVLGEGPSSRLFRIIREEKGYTYGVASSFSASRVNNYFSTSTSVRTEVTEPALAELLKQFTAIRDTPVPAGELADAKTAIVGGFVRGLESPGAILGRWIEQRQFGLPEDYWDTYSSKIQAVTAEDVQRVAKKYVPLDNPQVIAVGDASKIGEVMKKFGPVEELSPDK